MLAYSNCSSLACLRQQTTETLINAMQYSLAVGYTSKIYGWGDFYYGPSVDGEIVRSVANLFTQQLGPETLTSVQETCHPTSSSADTSVKCLLWLTET